MDPSTNTRGDLHAAFIRILQYLPGHQYILQSVAVDVLEDQPVIRVILVVVGGDVPGALIEYGQVLCD